VSELKLSEEDARHLEALAEQHKIIRSRVHQVAMGMYGGYYLYGPGGLGKTYTVRDELDKHGITPEPIDGRVSALALVQALRKFPESVHLVDDCESLLDDKQARNILRQALWSQSTKWPMERPIRWNVHKRRLNFVFTGGLIITANRALADIPELNAVKDRIPYNEFVASFAEVVALIRSVALKGHEHAGPAECLEVAEHIIARSRELGRSLTMRNYLSGMKDYLYWRNGGGGPHWKDLIASSLHETTRVRASRVEETARDRAIALEISQMKLSQKERLALWTERTGKSERAYWRRLAS